MELEELKSKFDASLGSTKLQLSEQTLNEVLQDALAEIGDDDTRATDDFITRKVNLAKKIDGQINFDVSNRIKDWKKQNEKKPPVVPPKKKEDEDEEPAYFKAYREQLEAKFQKIEDERKAERVKAQKDSVFSKVKSILKDKFESAGIEANAYILKQTLRDIEIPDEDADATAIAKSAEKAYYKSLKEAGFEEAVPRAGGGSGSKKNKLTDDFFARKAKKEGWGNK